MRHIYVFNNISLDGYFEAPGHDISGFVNDFEAFSTNDGQVDTLMFGRKTYEGMKFWSTPQGKEMQPDVAQFMNAVHKIVVSHHDFDPGWDNVTVISKDVAESIRKLKQGVGGNIMIFGSNNLCVSLLNEGLIDEIQLLVNPVAFGDGTPIFTGMSQKTNFTLTKAHPFKSGVVMLTYKPVL